MTTQPARPIKTEYRNSSGIVKVNSSKDANKAVANCVYLMQINLYGAKVAEVFDSYTAELHAQITRSVNGDIKIVYRRNPVLYETRITLRAFK